MADTDLGPALQRCIESLRADLLALSRDLYEHPELSLQETRSSSRLQCTAAISR